MREKRFRWYAATLLLLGASAPAAAQGTQPQATAQRGAPVTVQSSQPFSPANVPQATEQELADLARRHDVPPPQGGSHGVARNPETQAARAAMRAAMVGDGVGAGVPLGAPQAPAYREPAAPPAGAYNEEMLTPQALNNFEGLAQNGSVPSDMGLAVGASQIVQAVNVSITVLGKTTGLPAAGFPKTLNAFFGRPTTALLFDPRATYDWVGNRFIVIADELDRPGSRGFIHVAVSQTSSATGGWWRYRIQMGGVGVCPDYPTLGFDRSAIYIAANKFRCNTTGFTGPFTDAEVWALPKARVYAGLGFSFPLFFNLTANGVRVDTVQPANVMNRSDRPRAGFLVNSFNINSGGGQCFVGCSGLVVWAFSNPLNTTGGARLNGVVVPTRTYYLSFGAHQPGSTFSISTVDTRLTGEVYYSAGSLWASLNTGCVPTCSANPEQTSIVWWEIQPTLNDNDATCTGASLNLCPRITKATVRQQDCYFCASGGVNNGSRFFGTVQPDPENNITVVYNYSDSAIFAGTAYSSRRVTQAHSTLHDSGIFLRSGLAFYSFGRWGDYTDSAPDLTDPSSPSMWYSGMYARANGTWGTKIGRNTFNSIAQP